MGVEMEYRRSIDSSSTNLATFEGRLLGGFCIDCFRCNVGFTFVMGEFCACFSRYSTTCLSRSS